MKLVTVSEMQLIEKQAIDSGSSIDSLMQKAGTGIADFIEKNFSSGKKVVTGLVGSGNNGGDVLVALAILARNGWVAQVVLVRQRERKDPLLQRLLENGGQVFVAKDSKDGSELKAWMENSTLLVDGVLGAGIKLPLKPEVAVLLGFIKKMKLNLPVIAVDCPSGVDMENGQAAPETIPAAITLCMGAVKTGLMQFPAFALAGELHVVDLGFSANLSAWQSIKSEVVNSELVKSLLPMRDANAHKGTFGTALIVAGSTNYTGAALLSAKAAYRVGAGLVRLAVPGPIYPAIAGHLPEATWVILPHEQGVIHSDAASLIMKNMDKVTTMLLGPGWGREEITGEFLRKLVFSNSTSSRKGRIGFLEDGSNAGKTTKQLPPMVIDADGLNLLSQIESWSATLPEGTILTPHPGEMATLTGLAVDDIQKDRLGIAGKYSKSWNQVIVLKGALTVIAAPDGRIFMIPSATSALAKAGTGDVLAGMITGLRAQGLGAVESAICAAWIHGQAGLLAANKVGDGAAVLASDVIEAVAGVITTLR
jgi:NAD(P)H-hydrate epimerase